MASSGTLKKVSLSTNPTDEALRALEIGDVVYLNGVVYTGREGAYMKVIEDGAQAIAIAEPAIHARQPDGGAHRIGSMPCTRSASV